MVDHMLYYIHRTGQDEKGEQMEGMTNEQFKTTLKMIIQMIKDSKDKEEAVKKIEALLEKE